MVDRRGDERDAVDSPESARTLPFPSTGVQHRPSGLTAALRRARVESAERTDVVSELRGAEMTRLEILREHLQPVFDEVPADCDLFDPGIAPGEKPRLFIDMVAFVEMGRDRRVYRFLQDSRAGRTVLAESERIDTVVRSVTDYIARRVIERERAMISMAAPTPVRTGAAAAETGAAEPIVTAPPSPPRSRPRAVRLAARAFLFLIEIVGSAVVFGALATAAIWAWQTYVR